MHRPTTESTDRDVRRPTSTRIGAVWHGRSGSAVRAARQYLLDSTPFDVTKDRQAEHLNRHGCDGGSDREMTATTIVKLIAVSPVV